MSITIGSNIASLQAQRRLGLANIGVNASLERLSSGQRINRAADDAAGLAISSALRADTRVASAAVRNANYGVSAIAIADSGLEAITYILTRMGELAEQSANGVYTTAQRSPLNNEFLALASEIERIATTTTFNNITLLSGSSNLTLQVGFDSYSTSQITIASVQGTLETLGLASAGSLTFSITANDLSDAGIAARTALAAVQNAIDQVAKRRGELGATESRLHTAIDSLQVARENYEVASSRITDADVAQETANLLRLTIVQQSSTAILAQANQQPQLAYQLLNIRS